MGHQDVSRPIFRPTFNKAFNLHDKSISSLLYYVPYAWELYELICIVSDRHVVYNKVWGAGKLKWVVGVDLPYIPTKHNATTFSEPLDLHVANYAHKNY